MADIGVGDEFLDLSWLHARASGLELASRHERQNVQRAVLALVEDAHCS